jgi:hypothetical protein
MLSDIEQSTYTFTVDARQLSVDRPLLERVLGYKKGCTPEVVCSLIEEILPLIPEYLGVQCGYTILRAGTVTFGNEELRCDGVQFATGSLITKRLSKSRSLALFVATIGPELEQWSRQLIAQGDFLRGYIVDAIGSDLVEQAADCLERKLGENVQPLGWKITSRYSPGYCGWSVAEQHKLFSFLPEKFCGITLTESALMIPIKSVSGVIGLGPNVEREDYECSICDMEDCFRRRETVDPQAK